MPHLLKEHKPSSVPAAFLLLLLLEPPLARVGAFPPNHSLG